MEFLRWLYRDVNPMILILALVLLFALFNLTTCRGEERVAETNQTVAVAEEAVEGNEQKSSGSVLSRLFTGDEDQTTRDESSVAEPKGTADDSSETVAKPVESDEPVAADSSVAANKQAETKQIAPTGGPANEAPESTPEPEEPEPTVKPSQPASAEKTVAETDQAEPEEPKRRFFGLFGGADETAAESAATESQSEQSANTDESNAKASGEGHAAADPSGTRTTEIQPPPPQMPVVADNVALLTDARRAFWDRNYSAAQDAYLELIELEPNNPALLKEYGDMLLQSGQVEATLDVYERAALMYIDQGQRQKAKPLVDYIGSWDRDRADAIVNRVFSG